MIKWILGIPPVVGSKWRLVGTPTFVDTYVVKVVLVKDGWVQYESNGGAKSYRGVRGVRDFRSLYREIKDE